MKDTIGIENYVCEKYPSKTHDENNVEIIVGLLALILFMAGCLQVVEQVMACSEWNVTSIGGPSETPILANLWPGMCLIALSAVVSFGIFRPLYLQSYRYSDDSGRRNDTVKHGPYPDEESPKGNWVFIPYTMCSVIGLRSEAEYLINALYQPKLTYIRVSENLRPSARSLAVETRLDLEHIGFYYGDKWEALRKKKDESRRVVVPVVFQKRGELANHLRVTDIEDSPISTVRASEVAELLVDTLDWLIKQYADDEGQESWAGLRGGFLDELGNTSKAMDSTCVGNVRDVLLGAANSNEEIRKLASALYIAIGILEKCYVLCVRISIPEDVREVITISTKQRIPLLTKPCDFVRPYTSNGIRRSCGKLIAKLNERFNGAKKSSGVFYYNLASANLTKSYHLMMLGPDDTFCARGDILEIPPIRTDSVRLESLPNKGKPFDYSFKCERLRGQRHAHVLFREARNYQHAAFVFHYIGRPQDLFFAAGLLALVCLVGLLVGMVEAKTGTESLGTDVPAMMLVVLSAVCPWLYDRERNDRTESALLDSSAFFTTCASIVGLLIFVHSRLNLGICSSEVTLTVWLALIVLSAADATALLFLSLMHASLYKAQRLGRIDNAYGIHRLAEWLAGLRAFGFGKSFNNAIGKLPKQIRHVLGRYENRALEGMPYLSEDSGPFVASRDWPKGWLAVSGSFWWESERERIMSAITP